MFSTVNTLQLDRVAWDVVLNACGQIACATDPYKVTQDVASAIRNFREERWYDTTLGNKKKIRAN